MGKKSWKNSKSSNQKTILFLICMVIGFAAICVGNVIRTFDLLNDQTRQSLSHIASSNAALINDRLEQIKRMSETLAAGFAADPAGNLEEKMNHLRPQALAAGAVCIGVADLQGNAVTTDRERLTVADRGYFLQALQGFSSISGILDDKLNPSEKIVISAAPIRQGIVITGVLFVVRSPATLEEVLNQTGFDGGGASFLMTPAGDTVFHSTQNSDLFFDSSQSFLTQMQPENTPDMCTTVQELFTQRRSGICRLALNGGKVYLSCAPVSENEWLLISFVSQNAAGDKSNTVLTRAIVFSSGTFFIFTAVLVFFAASQRKSAQRIRRIAYVDRVTGIGNYTYFLSKCEERLRSRHDGRFAMVYFDIENFKTINDTFGYEFGDRMLTSIAGILRKELCHGEVFARLSNDYFAFFTTYRHSPDEVFSQLQGLRRHFQDLELHSAARISLSMPTGIYLVQEGDSDVNQIINRATMAHNTAKSASIPEHVVFYSDDIRVRLNEENQIAGEIHRALENGEFSVYYQPKFVLQTEQLAGYEALIRWNHPEKGIVSPGKFIPIAERTGSITEIGRYVFEQVCRDIRSWMDLDYSVVPVSFNLSRVELYQKDLMEFINRTMRRYQIPSYYLEAEITETAAIDSTLPIQNVIDRFKVFGIKVSMDDFGTGYSSLSCLKSMPIDILKLDRTFLFDIEADESSRNIARAVISLAKTLNLVVLSEGVETRAQADFLIKAGCDLVQGFFFGRPQKKEIAQRYMNEAYDSLKEEL